MSALTILCLSACAGVSVVGYVRCARARRRYMQARTNYAALIRHRLAQPLSVILLAADSLTRENTSPETRPFLVRSIKEAADRLIDIPLTPEAVSPEEECLAPPLD